MAVSSVFEQWKDRAFPNRYDVTLHFDRIAGGVPPADSGKIAGWLKTKLADKQELIEREVAVVMVERGMTRDEAADSLEKEKHVNGFRKDENGLYLGDYQVMALLKEASNVVWPYDQGFRWGEKGPFKKNATMKGNKGVKSAIPEVMAPLQRRLYFGVNEPTDVALQFPKNLTGQRAMQLVEYLEDVKVSFTLESAFDLGDEGWGVLWSRAEILGLGACRSQGFGRFSVTQWDRI